MTLQYVALSVQVKAKNRRSPAYSLPVSKTRQNKVDRAVTRFKSLVCISRNWQKQLGHVLCCPLRWWIGAYHLNAHWLFDPSFKLIHMTLTRPLLRLSKYTAKFCKCCIKWHMFNHNWDYCSWFSSSVCENTQLTHLTYFKAQLGKQTCKKYSILGLQAHKQNVYRVL